MGTDHASLRFGIWGPLCGGISSCIRRDKAIFGEKLKIQFVSALFDEGADILVLVQEVG